MLKWNQKVRGLGLSFMVLGALAACEDDGGITTPQPLTQPAGVSASLSGTAVEVTWSAVTGAESYVVQRDLVGDDASFTDIASGLTGTSYTDEGVSPGATYFYRVQALRDAERSAASDPIEVEVPSDAPALAVLSGTIEEGEVRELSADSVYLMQGLVKVASGAELHIPAGTTLLGDVNVAPTALLVEVGGKIFAEGTAEAPIVFTSSAPEGQRSRGDWGGVLIAGDSYCNFELPCRSEGIEVLYGGEDVDDNSGVLSYVRIEFAGYEASPGNELNGLGLFGVGRGTRIDHVQVHFGSDDGIELFGGTVDIKYAITTGNDDDSFDYSTGWQGRGQFWIVQQAENSGDRGFEVDGNESDYTAQPLTDPRIYNVTVVGNATDNDGLTLRRGTAGLIRNAIVMNFGDAGLDVDNEETTAHCSQALLLDNVIFWSNAESFDGDDDGFEQSCVGTNVWEVDPQLGDALNRTAPNFQPQAGSPAVTHEAAQVPADDFFEPADFLGAVAPEGTPWYAGWTTTAQN